MHFRRNDRTKFKLHWFLLLIFINVNLVLCQQDIEPNNGEVGQSPHRKKELKDPNLSEAAVTAITVNKPKKLFNLTSTNSAEKPVDVSNAAMNSTTKFSTDELQISDSENPIIKPIFPYESGNDMSEALQTGFLICMMIGICAVAFISWKAYSMRRSRAERRYGVQGDRGAQELTPLPMAIEQEESDNEDQTVFDINRVS